MPTHFERISPDLRISLVHSTLTSDNRPREAEMYYLKRVKGPPDPWRNRPTLQVRDGQLLYIATKASSAPRCRQLHIKSETSIASMAVEYPDLSAQPQGSGYNSFR